MDNEETHAEQTGDAGDVIVEERDENYRLGASRDDLLQAAHEAKEDEPEAAAAPTPPAAKQARPSATHTETATKEPPTETPEPDDEGLPKLAKLLRAREQAREIEEKNQEISARAQAEAQSLRESARREADQYLAAARRQAADELAALKARLSGSPADTLRALNYEPQKLVDDLAREGTPEWRALQAQQQELQALKAKAGDFDAFRAEYAHEREARARASAEQDRYTRERAFLEQAATAEKCPALHALYDPDEIVAKGYRMVQSAQAALVAQGLTDAQIQRQLPTDSDIAEYLEYSALQRLTKRGEQGASASNGKATQPKAAGSRTPSASVASERRAGPRSHLELSPQEQRAELIEIAEEQLRARPR